MGITVHLVCQESPCLHRITISMFPTRPASSVLALAYMTTLHAPAWINDWTPIRCTREPLGARKLFEAAWNQWFRLRKPGPKHMNICGQCLPSLQTQPAQCQARRPRPTKRPRVGCRLRLGSTRPRLQTRPQSSMPFRNSSLRKASLLFRHLHLPEDHTRQRNHPESDRPITIMMPTRPRCLPAQPRRRRRPTVPSTPTARSNLASAIMNHLHTRSEKLELSQERLPRGKTDHLNSSSFPQMMLIGRFSASQRGKYRPLSQWFSLWLP